MDDETRDLLLSLKATIEQNQPPPFLQTLAKTYIPLLGILITVIFYFNGIENTYKEDRIKVHQMIKDVDSELANAKRQTEFNFATLHEFLDRESPSNTLTLIKIE